VLSRCFLPDFNSAATAVIQLEWPIFSAARSLRVACPPLSPFERRLARTPSGLEASDGWFKLCSTGGANIAPGNSSSSTAAAAGGGVGGTGGVNADSAEAGGTLGSTSDAGSVPALPGGCAAPLVTQRRQPVQVMN
jgi:hypothetical protein